MVSSLYLVMSHYYRSNKRRRAVSVRAGRPCYPIYPPTYIGAGFDSSPTRLLAHYPGATAVYPYNRKVKAKIPIIELNNMILPCPSLIPQF